jgi:hypothetical protein
MPRRISTASRYGLIANVLTVPVMGLVVMPAAVLAALLGPSASPGSPLAAMEPGHRLHSRGRAAGLGPSGRSGLRAEPAAGHGLGLVIGSAASC